MGMDPDEKLYEIAMEELASSPRTSLLAKCRAKSGMDENKAKTKYIEIRVKELKIQIVEEAKRAKQRGEAEPQEEQSRVPIGVWLLVALIIAFMIAIAADN